MGAANKCQIVLGTTAMEVTREPVASNTPELFPKSMIVGVYPVKINDKANLPVIERPNWTYRFDVMTVIDVEMADGSHFKVELQEVTNKSGWNGGNLAAQQQAVADINAWL